MQCSNLIYPNLTLPNQTIKECNLPGDQNDMKRRRRGGGQGLFRQG